MKKRAYLKIACTAAALLAAMAMIVMSSYAWLTASTSPVAEGIQVAVGGGSTILLAPDLVDENKVHYPGAFGATLQLDDLLNTAEHSGLTPVSTADGVNWYLPAYYAADDPEVLAGTAIAGDLKPYNQFLCDTTLTYANLLAGDEKAAKGSYLYADFWVVSPGSRYELRVSTSDEASGAGSYVVDMQQVVETETGRFALQASENPASESIRIGFLVNLNEAADSKAAYTAAGGDQRYTKLMGVYQAAGQVLSPQYSYNLFHIYEPNGSSHSSLANMDGSYLLTYPLGTESGGGIAGVGVGDRLSVQMKSMWSTTAEEMFAACVQQAEAAGGSVSAAELQEQFYQKTLSGLSGYVTKGRFIQDTASLYLKAGEGQTVSADELAALPKAGAGEKSSIVTLERNVPQRIRMFIWLEGQDADCISGASMGSVALRIELAGSTIK